MSTSIYNRATQANRQPGSAFKLFVYLAALEAGYKPDDDRRRAGHDQRLEPAQQQWPQFGPVPVRRPSPSRSTPSRCGSARRSASAPSPTWRSASASPRRSTPIRRWCWARSDVRLIDMTRAFASVARGGVAVDALRHQPGDHRRRRAALPAPGRRAAGAGRALGRGADDRPAAGAWSSRHRPRRRRSAGRSPARPARPRSNKDGWFLGFSSGLTTGVWMGRDDNRALARPAGRPRAGARLPRFHGPRRRQPAGRAVRDRGRPAPDWQMRARRGASGSRRPTTTPLRRCRRQSRSSAGRRRRDEDRRGRGPRDEDDVRPERLDRRELDERPIDRPRPPRRRGDRRGRDARRHLRRDCSARPDPVERGALALSQARAGLGIGAEQARRPERGNPGRG